MMHKRVRQLPIMIERDEDGYYVVECPLFSGCYTQGKTLDAALKNIREVIALCLEEKDNRARLLDYHPQELAFHTLMYA
jgi:predicted RNase H-like HicB family nuclease